MILWVASAFELGFIRSTCFRPYPWGLAEDIFCKVTYIFLLFLVISLGLTAVFYAPQLMPILLMGDGGWQRPWGAVSVVAEVREGQGVSPMSGKSPKLFRQWGHPYFRADQSSVTTS